MGQYTEKPGVYDAIQWDGQTSTADDIVALVDFNSSGSHTYQINAGVLDVIGSVYGISLQQGEWVVAGPRWGAPVPRPPLAVLSDDQVQARFETSV